MSDLNIDIAPGKSSKPSPKIVPGASFLILEDGSLLLIETGYGLVLEQGD